MAEKITISRGEQNRNWDIHGGPGAKFEIYVKQGSNYYNFDTDSFQGVVKTLKTEIPSNGFFRRSIAIPQVSANTSYDFFIRPIGNTTSSLNTTNEQKIGTIFQKGTATATFTTTEDLTLSIASALTGGTLSTPNLKLTQTGAITEASGLFVYIHTVPTWDIETGGAWTLSNTVKTKVNSSDKTIVYVDDGTNIVSGYSVTGEGILDEITVSAISGNMVTLSAAQRLKAGEILTFSKSGWEFKNIRAKAENSGTTSVTMSNMAEVEKVGIADIICELDIDEYVSVKPNAFPIPDVVCPAGGSVVIKCHLECTNFLGRIGDLDANLASKVFKVHSIPSGATSSAAIRTGDLATFGILKNEGGDTYSAGQTLGTATTDLVYHAHALMEAGDTDIFYYKTTDAQSSAVDSSTTQGKVTVTIV